MKGNTVTVNSPAVIMSHVFLYDKVSLTNENTVSGHRDRQTCKQKVEDSIHI